MSKEISCIVGVEPRRDDEYPVCYKVGSGNVTKIEQGSFSEQPFCETMFFNVYKDDQLYSTVTWNGVAEIFYKQKESNDG